jgi:hypothetical protein
MQFTIGDVYTTSGQPAVAIGQFQEAIFWSTAVLSSSDMSAVCSNAVGTNGWSTTGASC